ncbi:MAG: DUF1559 domain-containing protein [Planctomycetes bacterium]|nr:DUF1559 domain-containing protein [Planctomycetota bacterium]
MAVTLMLSGLMFPALMHVRENAHRIICSSNLRQIGLAAVLFADAHNGFLPPSEYGKSGGAKQEMMAVHRGGAPENWEGLGWLHWFRYFNGPQVLYCPSHHGEHFYDRYEELYNHPDRRPIYSNYHYAGPRDWDKGTKRRLDRGKEVVIATDGLRTIRDFNHSVGMNVLRGDNSVRWRDDISGRVKDMLPPGEAAAQSDDDNDDTRYSRIWDLIGGSSG